MCCLKLSIKENPIIKFLIRIGKFIIFQYIFRKGNITLFILKSKTKDGIIKRNVQGNMMYLDLNDKGISSELALYGIREPESTKFIQKTIKEGNIVVDIGANIGYYALMEAKMVGKKGRVYVIEPVPNNVEALKKNIELNSISNIDVFQLAIGEKSKKANINISKYSNWHSLLVLEKDITGTIGVQVMSLDKFLRDKKNPDFIRMDVEGYEYNIIKGMKNILKSKKTLKLFIEIHPHIIKKEQTIFVLKTLMDHGFETTKVTRSFTMHEMMVKNRDEYDYSWKTIKDLIEDESIISGSKGAFEIFFEKKLTKKGY